MCACLIMLFVPLLVIAVDFYAILPCFAFIIFFCSSYHHVDALEEGFFYIESKYWQKSTSDYCVVIASVGSPAGVDSAPVLPALSVVAWFA